MNCKINLMELSQFTNFPKLCLVFCAGRFNVLKHADFYIWLLYPFQDKENHSAICTSHLAKLNVWNIYTLANILLVRCLQWKDNDFISIANGISIDPNCVAWMSPYLGHEQQTAGLDNPNRWIFWCASFIISSRDMIVRSKWSNRCG
jgi:hypothetical protein